MFFEAGSTTYDILDSKLYVDDKEWDISLTNLENDVTIIVFYSAMKCEKQNHNIESIAAQVLNFIKQDEVFIINIRHCNDCGIYFINNISLERYHKDGLYPYIRYYDGIHPFDDYYYSGKLSPQSRLNSYGYNTQISTVLRQRILLEILNKNLILKPKIITHLEWLLWISKNNLLMQRTRRYWEEDLFLVNNHNIQYQKRVSGYLDYRK